MLIYIGIYVSGGYGTWFAGIIGIKLGVDSKQRREVLCMSELIDVFDIMISTICRSVVRNWYIFLYSSVDCVLW